jgi:nucleotide-binding universal stress UspA family protein
MIKRVLVGLAGTPYTPVAIQRAITIAQANSAEVTGVTVLDLARVRRLAQVQSALTRADDARGQRLAIMESRITESIREFEEACERAKVPYHVVEENGDPFTKLVDLARYHDMIVFGLRSIFEWEFHSGSPQELLIHLVGAGVRPIIAVPQTYRPISRVVIAYSGSMESAKAMKRFVQMRICPDAQLKIITFHPSGDEACKLAVAAAGYCRAHGYHVEHQSNLGQARDLLLAAATLWQADMIVMGNSARSVWIRRILGDTLLDVLSQAEIPLFLAQ